MIAKNSDYGDSWRDMRLVSITDQILVKTKRIIQLEELQSSGKSPKVSEGIESEYRDILNYCVFALIKMKEANNVEIRKPIDEVSKPARNFMSNERNTNLKTINGNDIKLLNDIKNNIVKTSDTILGLDSCAMDMFFNFGYCKIVDGVYELTPYGDDLLKEYYDQ
jgi:hypothetical protein